VLEVWEGYATDPEIRFKGSSGGVVTALALFCLENEDIAGVLQVGANPQNPWKNMPVFSRNKSDLLACTGSRYSPAAPCERLDWIEQAQASCVFVGKPCDVVGLRKSEAVDAKLNSKVSLLISIFCATTPTSKGTQILLEELDVEPEQVEELRYRGCGWPGRTTVKIRGSSGEIRQMDYEQSWGGILSRYGQLRCRLCPDSTGEFADISCGDPWYREIEPDEPGWSLVLIRTERGREILQKAIRSGYVSLHKLHPDTLPRAQKALLQKRCHLFGRLLSMKITGVPSPKFTGFSLLANWRSLPIGAKACSILGTLKRSIFRKWILPVNPILHTFPTEESRRLLKTVADRSTKGD
jgi:coenzyme F420 hydrogenase subunit beta